MCVAADSVSAMTNSSNHADYRVRRHDDKPGVGAGKGATVDFLQMLARAAHQFHTYPATSPLCTDAVAVCHAAFMALELEEPMTIRVGKRELLVQDEGIGRGTIIEQQLWRPLHRGRVASVEIKPDVALRDWSQFCPMVAAGLRRSRQSPSLADLLVEAGVGAIVARVTPRPELFEVGAPPAAMQVVVERERTRQSLLPASGPAQHLYPPDKGWVRLDPTVRYESISLLDLTVLINDPGELASMLTRLIDEDASDDTARAAALQHRYSDVVTLIGALDARLARILFSKLSRAVLSLDSDRRRSLLKGAILPGLLDGRLNGEAVLWDFPDLDLADALCLLLDLDAASPQVLAIALDRLQLPEERRTALAPLIKARLRNEGSAEPVKDRWSAAGFDGVAASLTRVTSDVARNFSEFAAFDLAMNEQTMSALDAVREAIAAAEVVDAQVRCALSLARIEPNPVIVSATLARTLPPLVQMVRAERWDAVTHVVTELQAIAARLQVPRPDVAKTVRETLVRFCNHEFLVRLAQLSAGEGRARAAAVVAAAGPSLVPAWLELLDGQTERTRARQLVPLMCERSASIAPSIAERLPLLNTDAACAALAVLAAAGPGYEDLIAEQVKSGEERRGREAMRALARIASPRAAALIAKHIENGPSVVQPAAEEALWRLPLPLAFAKTHELLRRREFVLHHPHAATRLLERAAQSEDHGLEPVLEGLTSLRFHFWSPAVARVGAKARELRQ
jgi:hypothetical protein